ncbi:MAG: hypothetical protein JWP04_2257 [Belnapia sp.]|nr:hypothetical protein [Belnapia sp.]
MRQSIRRPRRLLASLALLLLLASGCGPRTLMMPTDGNYDIERDVAYAAASPRQGLDIYRPRQPAAGPRPLVVYLYGGLWSMGEKEEPIAVALPGALAARGAVVVVPNYRLYPEAVFPGFMEDAAAAIAFARRNAAAYGADPRSIFIVGHSTGAYMAMLLGLDRHYLRDAGFGEPPPAGLVGLSGVYEPWLFENRALRPIYGPSPDRAVILPVSHIHPGMPPSLLLAGSWDLTVDPGNTTRLAAAIREADGEAEDKLYRGIGHIDILMAGPWMPSLAPTANDVAAFIRDRHAAALAR